MKMKYWGMAVLLLGAGMMTAPAQQRLSLDDCRQMAIAGSKTLDQARTKVEMAGYDRKIALANYFPEISATGGYVYNNRNLSLISKDASDALTGTGTKWQGAWSDKLTEILSDPSVAEAVASSEQLQSFVTQLQGVDIATPVNEIGNRINDAFTIDIQQMLGGAVTVKQPVFVGGKIIYSNQMAALAEKLAQNQYEMEYADIICDVDQAYWQIVSVAAKKELAESYADLLHKMEKDVDAAVRTGVSTASDALQVKVKANEADLLLTKATNGLALAKMLLCQKVGLPLDTQITLADEGSQWIPEPSRPEGKEMEAILSERPETQSLDLARQIYEKKVGIARADMMPRVAVVAGYSMTNPNMFHGYRHEWNGGLFSAGVVVNIPIFHGTEALQKTRKAKAEATLYADQYDDARETITLQVTQARSQFKEAQKKVEMARSSLSSAEENLRMATKGFEAGVIEANTALSAHTGWLQAHSEYIDAGVELQLAASNLQKAEGDFKSDLKEAE